MNEADYQRIIPVIGPYEKFPAKGEDPEAGVMLRAYVAVDARFSPEGKVTPLAVYWDGGKKYEVESVKSTEPAALLYPGKAGIRYICRVLGRDMQLFLAGDGRWYVERKQTE